MKIMTWNINGLRAALGKGALELVWKQKPDVLCLQEIKVRPDQLNDEQRNFSGYNIIWNPVQKAGYSGVATFLRTPALETQLGMDAPRFDVEGRLILYASCWFPSIQRLLPEWDSRQRARGLQIGFLYASA